MTRVAAITWKAWSRYLLEAIADTLTRCEVEPNTTPREVFDELGAVDIIVWHINLSLPGKMPRARAQIEAEAKSRGIRTLNGGVHDITKRFVQRHNRSRAWPDTSATCVGPPDELVIVKTNFNARGVADNRLEPWARDSLDYPDVRPARIEPETEYEVMRRRDVPAKTWADAYMHVERFVENGQRRFFRIYLVGDRVVVSAATSDKVVQRMEGNIERENYFVTRSMSRDGTSALFLPTDVASCLAHADAFALSFAVDYGVLDIVMDDAGGCYVVDVNVTPYWGGDRQPGMIAHLRSGLFEDRL